MKFLILYLLMTLAVVFALPTNMEKRGDIKMPKSSCRPATLTWKVRNVGSSKPQESFELNVRNSYVGRTSYSSPKVGKTIPSGDRKFSVNHSSTAASGSLTLTYLGSQYRFSQYSYGHVQWGDSGDEIIAIQYEYWACVKI